MHRPIRPTKRALGPLKGGAKRLDAAPPAPAWPSYTGTSTYVGTSADGLAEVFVDPSLGDPGVQNAIDLVNDAARIAALNEAFFGTPIGSVQVIVFALGGATDGTGGADHLGCDYQVGAQIEVCASFGNSMRCSGLFEAELSECSMNNNLCGLSTGEALSRWCAMDVSSNALGDFATAPTWVADGSPNFVDTTDPTDTNPDSIGCGMAFLSWLQSMGYTLSQIAQSMVALGDTGTLCQLYGALTNDAPSNAWTKFQAAIAALPYGVVDDDPFSGASTPAPGPVPPTVPAPAPSVTLEQAVAWATQGLTENWPS